MTKVTKTLNPLHFEDLEPHRFEDLVRQLVYDLKDWRLLEPTGRLGADDGYDARGFEIMNLLEEEKIIETTDEDDDNNTSVDNDRLWQIQCKREKSISPSKITRYIDEIIPSDATIPYGIIFAAPCDFSKKTRDVFIAKIREKGVKEFYIWGKADLEDLLFQPKNDNLLYGFFGISLIIRRRTLKSELRTWLATKKKTIKHLGEVGQRSYKEVLLRDINDKQYPDKTEVPNFNEKPAWKKFYFVGHYYNGIIIRSKRYYAYIDYDYEKNKINSWDFTNYVNLAAPHNDIWENKNRNVNKNYPVYMFWKDIPKEKQAYFDIDILIPYERLIEIDASGDEYAECPHVYVERAKDGLFSKMYMHTLTPPENWGFPVTYIYNEDDKIKKKFFPDIFPDPKPEPTLAQGNNVEPLKS